nr:hypothetical protein [Tanacetum cinerariifolium]
MRPFGCPVTILNTLDSLGKFDGKVDEGFLVGYSVSSKAFRVFNSRTHIIQETLHVNFLENKPNVAGSDPTWLFDIDSLTKTMNYQPITAGNQTSAGFQGKFDAEKAEEEINQQYVFFPVWSSGSTNPQNFGGDAVFDDKNPESEVIVSPSSSAQSRKQDDKTKKEAKGKSPVDTNTFSAAGPSNVAASPTYEKYSFIDASQLPADPNMPELEDITYSDDEDDVGAEADFNNLLTSITISPIPTSRVHKDHPVTQIIGDLSSTTQTRSMTKVVKDQGGLSHMFNDDFHTCMFVCFLSQEEPKRVHQALKDPSWIEAMQEELLQFKMFNDDFHTCMFVCFLSQEEPKRVFRNKKDERGIVVRNKARLVAQGHTQEEGIDYKEVFAPVARIKAIPLFLASASFMGFMVYQMDVKSAFLYGTIEEEVYVCQPLGFKDPDHPDKVYKVVKALSGLHQALRAWYETLANYLLENGFQRGKIDQTLFIKRQKGNILLVQIYVDDIIFGATNKDLCKSFEKLMKDKFQMSSIGELTFFLGLQVKQKKDGIFISQDKYVAEILRKFGLTEGKSACTPTDTEKPLLKDPDVKRIFRYLKGKPHLGLWYLKDSPFDLVAYSDGDYVGASLDRKSTTRGCQFLECRLISWQCKKQTVVATSSTEAEYVAAASFCAQVLWIQNQLLDYGNMLLLLVQKVNDVTRLQALVDKKKVVVTEATIREALRLDDEEGVECALSTHTSKYTSPTLNQKVFANMRRIGKGFSGVETPLFEGMLVEQQVVEEGDADENEENVNAGDAAVGDVSAAHGEVPTVAEEPSIPSPTPPTPPPQPPQDIPSTSQKVGTTQRVETSDETKMDDVSNQERMIAEMDQDADVVLEDVKEDDKEVTDAIKDVQESVQDQGRTAESQAEIYKIDMDHANKVLSIQEDETEPAKVQEVVDVVTTAKLIAEVVTAASETISAASAIISSVEAQVPASFPSTIIPDETKSKDKGKGILVEEPKPLKKQAQIKQDEKYARELEVELNRTIDWDEAIDHVKRKAQEDPAIKTYQVLKRKPQTKAQARKNMMMDEEDSRALKRLNETRVEKVAKKQKLGEEVEELKRHLQIVPNEDDDVYTEATYLLEKSLLLIIRSLN